MTLNTSRPGSRRSRLGMAAAALVATTLVTGLSQLPAVGETSPQAAPATPDLITFGDSPAGLSDLDARGTALPTAAQQVRRRPPRLDDLRWNHFGTPSSILPTDGSLGRTSSGDAAVAARTWLRRNTAVLGISAAQVDGLELVNSQKLAQTGARAVLFRQTFGDLSPAIGSMVTVGVANGADHLRLLLAHPRHRRPDRRQRRAPPGRGLARRRPPTSAATPSTPPRSSSGVTRRLDPAQGPRLRPGAAGPAPGPRARRRHRPPGLRGQRRRRRQAAPRSPTR